MSLELDDFKQEVQKNKDHHGAVRNKPIIGLGLAMTAMFLILVMMLANLSSVLGRRSPFMEYTVCFNDRVIEERKATSDLNQEVIVSLKAGELMISDSALKKYLDANKKLQEANNLSSKNRCPGLDVVKNPVGS